MTEVGLMTDNICIRCGYCCKKATCTVGRAYGAGESKCHFLLGDGPGKYYCFLADKHPELKNNLSISIGSGCSSPLNTDRKEVPDILKYLIALQNLLSKNKMQYDFYEWLIRGGKLFYDSDRNKKREEEIIRNGFPYEVRNCFYNSQMIALADEKYPLCEYYEGWYLKEGIPFPMEHGFIVEQNKVIDVTVNNRGKVLEYYGVLVPKNLLTEVICDTGVSEAMLYRHWDKFKYTVGQTGGGKCQN